MMGDLIYDVSVVICAYTEERWLELTKAVASIQRQTLQPREIIVVIDHNTLLLERVQIHITGIILIENGEERGISGARNTGVARAQGELIAFLDDDAIAESDWLELLARCCMDAQVLGAGGAVEPLWPDKRPAWFPREFYWVVGCSYQRLPETPFAMRNPYGGCTCIRREVFEKVGGFRNGIGRVGAVPLGCEETEFAIRAGQHWPDKVFLCEPRARIHHHVTPRRARWQYFQSRCYAEGFSKAIISRYVGAKDGLSSERIYTLRDLPEGVLRGVGDAILRFDLTGLQRAGAIVAGLVITTTGYLVGTTARPSVSSEEIPKSASLVLEKSLHRVTKV